MKLDRVFGDAESLGNLAIAQSVGDQRQHLVLARRQRLDERRGLIVQFSHVVSDVRR
jgi:hypothetical protein